LQYQGIQKIRLKQGFSHSKNVLSIYRGCGIARFDHVELLAVLAKSSLHLAGDCRSAGRAGLLQWGLIAWAALDKYERILVGVARGAWSLDSGLPLSQQSS
jgi:hypothetical protein